jgi:hypothetical protein
LGSIGEESFPPASALLPHAAVAAVPPPGPPPGPGRLAIPKELQSMPNVGAAAAAIGAARLRTAGRASLLSDAAHFPALLARGGFSGARATSPPQPVLPRGSERGASKSPSRASPDDRRRPSPPRPLGQFEPLPTKKEQPLPRQTQEQPPPPPPPLNLEQPPLPAPQRPVSPLHPASDASSSSSSSSSNSGLSKAEKKELKALQTKKKAGDVLEVIELRRYKALKEAWAAELEAATASQLSADTVEDAARDGEASGVNNAGPGRSRGRGAAALFGSALPRLLNTGKANIEQVDRRRSGGRGGNSSTVSDGPSPQPTQPLAPPPKHLEQPPVPLYQPFPSPLSAPVSSAPTASSSPRREGTGIGNTSGLSKAEKKELKALQTKKKAGTAMEGIESLRYKELKARFLESQ